ncbi:MAG: NAD(P)-dependent oxidoreductase [Terracidiphilus sp.]
MPWLKCVDIHGESLFGAKSTRAQQAAYFLREGKPMLVSNFNWGGKRVLVTGGSGFKGAYMCAATLGLGSRVYATCRNHIDPASSFSLLGMDAAVTPVSLDITDRQAVYDMINTVEPDVIIHLAAKAIVPVGLRDPRRTLDVNIMGTLNLIEACRRLHLCNRILVCSTDHVFGNVKPDKLPPKGFDESARVSYGGPYDTSKAAMELVVRMYHSTYRRELPAIAITRCANVFGFGDTGPRRVIPLFVTTAKAGTIPLKYRLNGRQFIYITDAIAGYIRAVSSLPDAHTADFPDGAEAKSPFTPTFHFAIERYPGTDNPYVRMEALAQLVTERVGGRVDETNCVDYAEGENRVQALDCSTTRLGLSWAPQVPIEEGIDKLNSWYASVGDEARLTGLIRSEIGAIISSLGQTVMPAAKA